MKIEMTKSKVAVTLSEFDELFGFKSELSSLVQHAVANHRLFSIDTPEGSTLRAHKMTGPSTPESRALLAKARSTNGQANKAKQTTTAIDDQTHPEIRKRVTAVKNGKIKKYAARHGITHQTAVDMYKRGLLNFGPSGRIIGPNGTLKVDSTSTNVATEPAAKASPKIKRAKGLDWWTGVATKFLRAKKQLAKDEKATAAQGRDLKKRYDAGQVKFKTGMPYEVK